MRCSGASRFWPSSLQTGGRPSAFTPFSPPLLTLSSVGLCVPTAGEVDCLYVAAHISGITHPEQPTHRHLDRDPLTPSSCRQLLVHASATAHVCAELFNPSEERGADENSA